jgi:hypothetical protein
MRQSEAACRAMGGANSGVRRRMEDSLVIRDFDLSRHAHCPPCEVFATWFSAAPRAT